MRSSHPPSGTRFFGRVLSALLECPRCGRLDHFRRTATGATRHATARRRRAGTSATVHYGYDPQTGRWKCPSCQLICIIGLLAWPVRHGSGATSRPRDQVPDERQLAEMRAEGSGLWMYDKLARRRADGTNVTAGCTCRPGTAYTTAGDPNCPLHGGEEEPGV